MQLTSNRFKETARQKLQDGNLQMALEKLQTKDKKKPNFVVRAFQSHPLTDDRLKRAQATIAEMLPAKDEYMVSTSEFDEVKARLTQLTANKLRLGTKDDAKPKLKTTGNWQ